MLEETLLLSSDSETGNFHEPVVNDVKQVSNAVIEWYEDDCRRITMSFSFTRANSLKNWRMVDDQRSTRDA